MKKFISVIAVIIAALMLASLPVFAQSTEYKAPEGANVFKAAYIEEGITIDGKISEGEYGEGTRINNPIRMANSTFTTTTTATDNAEMKSEYFDFYFACDEENIYIAFEELGGAWDDAADADTTVGNAISKYVFRCNYIIRLGFNPENAYEYIQFGGANTSNTSTAGPGWRVLYRDKADNSGKNELIDVDLVKDFLTEFKFVKTLVSDGTVIADGGFDKDGNANSKNGQYKVACELKINKEALREVLNENFEKYYEEIPETMYCSFSTISFKWGEDFNTVAPPRVYLQYLTTDIKGKQADYAAYGLDESAQEYLPGVVIFEEKPEETTEPPTTEAPTAAPEETEAPVDSAEQSDAVTDAPTTAGGCGASISLAGMALVSILGTAATVIEKKRR